MIQVLDGVIKRQRLSLLSLPLSCWLLGSCVVDMGESNGVHAHEGESLGGWRDETGGGNPALQS